MNGKDAFVCWAPEGARWTDWVKPVPFITDSITFYNDGIWDFSIPPLFYVDQLRADCAIIIDLPSYEGIKEGLALARLGFRPIPLYNGTTAQQGSRALVDNRAIENALRWGASELKSITIAQDAPPAFLLDSNRVHRYRADETVFDNSWDIYDFDMPSAGFFLDNGIQNVVVRSERILADLHRILFGFQKKGITIFFTNGYRYPNEVALAKQPRRYK